MLCGLVKRAGRFDGRLFAFATVARVPLAMAARVAFALAARGQGAAAQQ
jgi:hypothetical protein